MDVHSMVAVANRGQLRRWRPTERADIVDAPGNVCADPAHELHMVLWRRPGLGTNLDPRPLEDEASYANLV